MSRIRSIKPEFFASASAKRLPMGARVLFASLWTQADDHGRLIGSVRAIAGAAFPHDDDVSEAEVGGWLALLESKGMIERYEVEGAKYVHVTNFNKHQRISHPTPSRLPTPPECEVTPESLASYSREVPESFATDQGTGSKEQGGEARAPPAPEIDSGKPEPHIPRRYVGGGGMDGFEATFAKVNWCKTAPDIMARYGSAWGHDYPALDGRNGRMTIDQAVRSQWKWFHRTRAQMGDEQVAVDELVRHLSDMNAKHRRDWERDGAPLPTVSRSTGKRPIAEGEEEPPDDTS